MHKTYLRLKITYELLEKTANGFNKNISCTNARKFFESGGYKNDIKDEIDFSLLFEHATLSIGGRDIQTIDGHISTIFDTSKTHFISQQKKSFFAI